MGAGSVGVARADGDAGGGHGGDSVGDECVEADVMGEEVAERVAGVWALATMGVLVGLLVSGVLFDVGGLRWWW